jgi:hypothetical protein
MAPKASKPTAASSRSQRTEAGPSQNEGIQSTAAEDASAHMPTTAEATGTIRVGRSQGSSHSRSSGRSRRSHTSSQSFQAQLRAQADQHARELAELKDLILRSRPLGDEPSVEPGNYIRPPPHFQSPGYEPPAVSGDYWTRHTPYPTRPDEPVRSVENATRNLSAALPPFTRLSSVPSSRQQDPTWKPRVGHPIELDDGEEPTWITWRISMDHKFDEDAPQFRSVRSRIRYVFSRTKGKANKLLRPYMKDGCPTPFTTVEEMYAALEELFTDPGEVEEARQDFRDLYMARNQSFAEFKMEFLQLAGLATISRTEYVDELYNKLTDKLKDALAPAKYKWGSNFTLASLEIQQTDTRFTLNAKQKQRVRIMTPTSASSTPRTRGVLFKPSDNLDRSGSPPVPVRTSTRSWSTAPPETARHSPVRTVPDRSSTPRSATDTSTLKCYNCGKFGHIGKHCDQPAQRGMIQEIEREESETEDVEEDPSEKEHA